MAFNIGTIGTDHIGKDPKGVLLSAILGAKTIDRIKKAGNVMTGVKHKENLTILDTDAVFQDGRNCTFNPSGTTTLGEKVIEVGAIKVQESLCASTLETTYLQKEMLAGSDYDSIIFEKEFMDRKAAKINLALEVAVWSGDKASGNAQLNRFDGLRKLAKAATDEVVRTVAGVTVATGVTEANVLDVLKGIYNGIPAEILEAEDLVCAVPMEWIRTYKARLTALNLFNYVADQSNNEAILIGTNLKVMGTPGLNGTNEAYAYRWSNVYFATDMLDEQDKAELFYAKENGDVRFSVRFKAGVQWGLTSEVVRFELLP
jgi:hypothetical protein